MLLPLLPLQLEDVLGTRTLAQGGTGGGSRIMSSRSAGAPQARGSSAGRGTTAHSSGQGHPAGADAAESTSAVEQGSPGAAREPTEEEIAVAFSRVRVAMAWMSMAAAHILILTVAVALVTCRLLVHATFWHIVWAIRARVCAWCGHITSLSALRRLLQYDDEGTGTIPTTSLEGLMSDLGLQLNAHQLSQAVAQLDRTGMGEVSFGEFLLWWRG